MSLLELVEIPGFGWSQFQRALWKLDFDQRIREETKFDGTEGRAPYLHLGEICLEYVPCLCSPAWSTWQAAVHPAVNAFHKADSQGWGKGAAYVCTYILKLRTLILEYDDNRGYVTG